MADQQPIVSSLDLSKQQLGLRFADEFAYSRYYLPALIEITSGVPALTFVQRDAVVRLAGLAAPGALQRWLKDIGSSELMAINGLSLPSAAPAPTGKPVKRPAIPLVRRLPLGSEDEIPGSGAPTDAQLQDLLLRTIQSQIGYVFLDRLRMRPIGFAIGPHVYTLPLSPGEEVMIEQKSYSKREITVEEATEREQTSDLELSSVLTTDLQESLERQQSLTDRSGLTLSHTGQYKSPPFFWGEFNANHTGTYSRDVTNADTLTRRQSTHDSQTTTTKVAAKLRSLHKTSFKTFTQTTFESTQRRVVRNPNKHTPVDYHYFKVMRVLQMSQERYGVRLCWAPFIETPARAFNRRLSNGKAAIIAAAEASLPPAPPPPVPTNTASGTKVVSQQFEADKWGSTGDQSVDYQISFDIPTGYEWDGSSESIAFIEENIVRTPVNMVRDNSANLVGIPFEQSGQLHLTIHVGIQSVWKDNRDFGKGSHLYISVKAPFKQILGSVAPPGDAYTAAFSDYTTKSQQWTADASDVRAKAVENADKWELEMIDHLDPSTEIVASIVEKYFPIEVRNSGAEVELWQTIFEWDAASYELYPGWWTSDDLREPTRDANDFLNASWARLFLTVRPGMEFTALRWIYGKTSQRPIDVRLERAIKAFVDDLTNFRDTHFGAVVTAGNPCPTITEKYDCLATWEETMPTDGTHIEVTQGATRVIEDEEQKAINLKLDQAAQDVEIRKAMAGQITTGTNLKVKIDVDTKSDE